MQATPPADEGRTADLDNVPDEAVQAGLDRMYAEEIRGVLLGIALVFAAVSVGDFLLYGLDVAIWLGGASILNMVLFGGTYLIHGRVDLPPDRWHDVIGILALSALVDASLAVAILGDPGQTIWMILVVLGTGLLIISHRWFVTVAGATVAGWLAMASTTLVSPRMLGPQWTLFGFALLIGVAVAAVVHVVHVRELEGLERQRLATERHRERLDREVKQRRRTEHQLRRSRARLRTVMEGAPVVLFATDEEGIFTFTEGKGLEALDLEPGELVGENVYEVYADVPAILEDIDRALAGEEFTDEVEVGDIVFETRYTPLEDDDGGVSGVVGVAVDVTERRVAQRREQQIERLEREAEFKSQLLNTLSHELNTPLTPIRMQLHRLKKADGMDDPGRRAVEVLERNVERLGRLVSDVLDVSRLEADRLDVRKEPIDLRELLDQEVAGFAAQADEEGVDLELDADGEVPVEADPDRISQVVANLLSNALKFTPEGGSVRVRTDERDRGVVVQVEDTGIGMTEEQRERLFEPFSRVHDPMEQTRTGTGLGLYICKGIVEGHGGAIWCESDGLGEGTTFSFRIPR